MVTSPNLCCNHCFMVEKKHSNIHRERSQNILDFLRYVVELYQLHFDVTVTFLAT